jgi:hypothetical protein
MEDGLIFILTQTLNNKYMHFTLNIFIYNSNSGIPRNFFRVGGGGAVQQIQWRKVGTENVDLGAVPL